jgi:hypothetical protein
MIGKWARNAPPGAEASAPGPRGDLLISGPVGWGRLEDVAVKFRRGVPDC